MPSEDTFHAEHPETNAWAESDPLLPNFSTPPGSSRDSASANAASRTKQAAHVQALAAKLGLDAEELAKKIPEDTLRRLKYPVILEEDPETGITKFKHDIGIVEARTPLLKIDRAHESIEKGKGGKGAGVPQPRTEGGRFSK